MLMRRFPHGSGYNFACQRMICFVTFSGEGALVARRCESDLWISKTCAISTVNSVSQQVRWGQRTLQPVLRVFVSVLSVRNQPMHAVRVTMTETYFASGKANFRS